LEDFDFSLANLEIQVTPINAVTSSPKFKDWHLKKSWLLECPVRMYMHSLSTQERLPDELHEAMLFWSFDPRASDTVVSYLNWVDSLEGFNRSRAAFESSCQMHDRILLGSLCVFVVVIIFVLLLSV